MDSDKHKQLKTSDFYYATDSIDHSLVEVIEPPVEDLVNEFKYKIQPTETHKELLRQIEIYYKENELFMTKRRFHASKRARAALMKIFHLVRHRRAELQHQGSNRFDKEIANNVENVRKTLGADHAIKERLWEKDNK